MNNMEFQLHKAKMAIQRFGSLYEFQRDNLNDYNEPDGTATTIASVTGLWHESQGYITTSKTDASTTRSKPSIQIMALWADANTIAQGDFITVSDTRYNVTGVHDVANAGVVADISLEACV